MVIRKSLLSLSIASVFALTACGSDNDKKPTPEPPPVVVAPEAPDAISFVVNGNVINQADSKLVPATISFFENGEVATNLVDINGVAITSIESAAGDFSVTTKEGSTASLVTAIVTAEGYISKSFVLDLNVAEGTSVLPVQFALVSKDAEGVADATETATVADGTVAEEITATAAEGTASAEVTIPASTVLQDADGNTITGTDISLNVTSSEKASTIVPEGLNAADATEVAVPVGVASVLMVDENGTKIKKFSEAIDITVNVPASAGVNEGDMLSVSSHNEDTGVWSTEDGKATVGALNAATNTFPATFMTDHLTVFAATTNSAACTGTSFNFAETTPKGLTLSVTSDDYTGSVGIRPGLDSMTFSVAGIAEDATAQVTIKDNTNNIWFQSAGEIAICGEVAIPALVNDSVTLVSQSADITGTCSNGGATSKLSGALVTYAQTGFGGVKAADNNDGTYELADVASGVEYTINTKLTGDKLKDITVPDTTFTAADGVVVEIAVDLGTCDTSTGGTGAG